MDDPSTPPNVVLDAITWLRDTGFGKPEQQYRAEKDISAKLREQFGDHGEFLRGRIVDVLKGFGTGHQAAQRIARAMFRCV